MAEVPEGFYAGDFGGGDILVVLDDWIAAQRDLAVADVLLRLLAMRHGLRFRANLEGRVPWPARRLLRRRLSESRELRLLLNPRFMEDGGVRAYELHVVRNAGPWIGYAPDEIARLGRFTPEEVSDRRFMEPILADAVRTRML